MRKYSESDIYFTEIRRKNTYAIVGKQMNKKNEKALKDEQQYMTMNPRYELNATKTNSELQK